MEKDKVNPKVQQKAAEKEGTHEDIWVSAFDSKNGTAVAAPPPLALDATHSGTGDEAYQRVLIAIGINPDGTGLPVGEQQLLAAMLQKLPISGASKTRDDGSLEVKLQQQDAVLTLHITPNLQGGEPIAKIDYSHGKYALHQDVSAGQQPQRHRGTEAGKENDVAAEQQAVQIVGIADDYYIEGKGGITISEEYLEEFEATKPITQEGGLGMHDPHIGYSRKIQVTAYDGRNIYLKVQARAAKQAAPNSLTGAPNEASFELLVTRQDGQQGFLSGSYADMGGSATLPEMLAALAAAND